MPIIVDTGEWENPVTGARAKVLPADPAQWGPVATTHEYIDMMCPAEHANHPDGNYHEPYDHAAVVEHYKRRGLAAPADPVKPGAPVGTPQAEPLPPPPAGT